MKKGLLLALFLGLATTTWAQKFEITPVIGYQYGGQVSAQEGDVNILSAPNLGLKLDYTISPFFQVEGNYSFMSTQLESTQRLTGDTEKFSDITVQYFHVGGLYQVPVGKGAPYMVGTLGGTYFKTPDDSGSWAFSLALGLGGKFYLSERFGLRLEGRFMLPFEVAKDSLFCEENTCKVGTIEDTTILQGDLTLGLIIKL